MHQDQIITQFKSFLASRNPDADQIDITSVRSIYGGASRQTFAMEITITRKTAKISRKIILRREFEAGIIDTKTRTEWDAYRAFSHTEVPVPELLWIEEDPLWMGTPFLVMEEIVGCDDSSELFRIAPYSGVREKIGEQFCRIMGTIPKMISAISLFESKPEKPDPDQCWKRELDYWEADINKNELEPHPILRAAIRRLRRDPPPPAQSVVPVHGDMRAGNFLFNKEGEIKAILDWEMFHLGDPMEDLTWALNPLWSWSEPDHLGYMIPRKRAIDIWKQTSGFAIEPKALSWWEIFSSVKGMAIWISMNKVYATGKNTDEIIGYGGMAALDFQRRILLQQMTEGK
jgi:aminoglycoside phosphotransferase (APT) family kinase protein